MKAVVIDRYGPPEVLTVRDVPKPEPGPGQVRIQVQAASVNPIDWRIRSGSFRFLLPQKFPLILGLDVAGVIDAIGTNVEGFSLGDRVYSRLDLKGSGGYAEFTVTRASVVAPIPESLSFTEAAALPLVALTALQSLTRFGPVTSGQRVLINGASGGVGTAAVQIACALGAEVTGVCSESNAELVKSLGATKVIDYRSEDFTLGVERYHLIFDVVANRTYGACRRVVTDHGIYLTLFPSAAFFFWWLVTKFSRRRVAFMDTKPSGGDLRFINRLVNDGKFKAVIDEVMPLENATEAHVKSESGHVRGKIVLTLDAAVASARPQNTSGDKAA